MLAESWPRIHQGRLGRGVVLDSNILFALRYRDDPGHERVSRRLCELAQEGLPLVVATLSLAELARRVQEANGPQAAGAVVAEAWEILNVIPPTEEDLKSAAALLAQGIELTLEEAVAGSLARRLGCSIYGASPAYHLFHLPVLVD